MAAGGSSLSRWLAAIVGSLMIPALLAGCAGALSPMAAPTPDARVRRSINTVWVSPDGVSGFDALRGGEWRPLAAGNHVSTDDFGEGLLKISDCMTIYLFQNGGLRKSPCPKSDALSGNTTCVIQGTAAFNSGCSGDVRIQTESAELVLKGTWVTVTYLPERGLTVLLVFEGPVLAQPVRQADTRTLDQPVQVDAQHFWFSTAGATSDPIAGLAAREPHPFSELPAVLSELGLERWIERIALRASQDNLVLDVSPAPSSPTPTILAPPTETPSATLSPSPPPAPLCTVVSRALNLRGGPGTSYASIRLMPGGTRLEPIGRNDGADWIAVRVQESGESGWVAAGAAWVSCTVDPGRLPVLPVPETSRPTATAAPPSRPSPLASVAFRADPPVVYSYREPQCSVLSWRAANVLAVALDGRRVAPEGAVQRCPEATESHTLQVQHLDRRIESYLATVRVVTDTLAPVISPPAIAPAPLTDRDRLTMTVQAADAESGLALVEIYVNRKLAARCQTATCTASAGPYPAGTIAYEIRAIDRSGNVGLVGDALRVEPGLPLPDLVASLSAAGTPAPDYRVGGVAYLPIRVAVTNQGNAEAGLFEVAAYQDGAIVMRQRVAALPPGSSATLEDIVVLRFNPPTAGTANVAQILSLYAVADVCDEGTSAYCRVRERDETNNRSNTIAIPFGSGAAGPSATTTPTATPTPTASPTPGKIERLLPDPTFTPTEGLVPAPTATWGLIFSTPTPAVTPATPIPTPAVIESAPTPSVEPPTPAPLVASPTP